MASQQCWGVTAGQARHNASNVGGVTAGQMGHNSSIYNIVKVKYLGHIICNDLSDDDNMMRQRRQLYAQGSVISRRFHMCSVEVKKMLFRTFCTPMYTCQLWWKFNAQRWHKLKVAYNTAYRMLHRLPTYCGVRCLQTIACLIVKQLSGI